MLSEAEKRRKKQRNQSSGKRSHCRNRRRDCRTSKGSRCDRWRTQAQWSGAFKTEEQVEARKRSIAETAGEACSAATQIASDNWVRTQTRAGTSDKKQGTHQIARSKTCETAGGPQRLNGNNCDEQDATGTNLERPD